MNDSITRCKVINGRSSCCTYFNRCRLMLVLADLVFAFFNAIAEAL